MEFQEVWCPLKFFNTGTTLLTRECQIWIIWRARGPLSLNSIIPCCPYISSSPRVFNILAELDLIRWREFDSSPDFRDKWIPLYPYHAPPLPFQQSILSNWVTLSSKSFIGKWSGVPSEHYLSEYSCMHIKVWQLTVCLPLFTVGNVPEVMHSPDLMYRLLSTFISIQGSPSYTTKCSGQICFRREHWVLLAGHHQVMCIFGHKLGGLNVWPGSNRDKNWGRRDSKISQIRMIKNITISLRRRIIYQWIYFPSFS